MAGTLTCMKAVAGSAIADTLRGASSGYDFGESETGQDASDKPLYLKHNGVVKITNLAVNVATYTGTYGGDYSAAADITKLLGHGDAAYGLQMDFRWNAADYWDAGQYTIIKSDTGNSMVNRVFIPTDAMSYNNAGTEQDASAPVLGELGQSGNSVLGDRAHITCRYQNPLGETQTGTRQFDLYFSFNFTS